MDITSSPFTLAGRFELREELREPGPLLRSFQTYDRLTRRTVLLTAYVGPRTGSGLQQLQQEFYRLRRLRHPRLVEAHDFFFGERPLDSKSTVQAFFTQQWYAGRTIDGRQGLMDPEEVRGHARKLLELMIFLHHRGFWGLDLQPSYIVDGTAGWHLLHLRLLEDALQESAEDRIQRDLVGLGKLLLSLSISCTGVNTDEEIRESLHGLKQTDKELASLLEVLIDAPEGRRFQSAMDVLEKLQPGAGQQWHLNAPLPEGVLQQCDVLLEEMGELAVQPSDTRGLVLLGREGSGVTRILDELGDRLQTGLALNERLRFNLEFAERGSAPRSNLELVRISPALAGPEAYGAVNLLRDALHLTLHGSPAPELALVRQEQARDTEDAQRRTRMQMVASLRGLILSSAQGARKGTRLVVLIDDFHALDQDSRDVFHRLFFFSDLPICLVLGGHDKEMSPFIAAALAPDAVKPVVSLFEPPPLLAEDVKSMIFDVFGTEVKPPTQRAVEHLSNAAEGLPAIVRQGLLSLWRTPELRTRLTSWSPANLSQLASALLSGYADDARAAARLLSTLHEPFSKELFDVLVPTRGNSRVLNTLLESGLLRLSPGPSRERPQLSFAYELHRQALYSTLSPEERLKFHLLVAKTMEVRWTRDPSISLRQLPHHFIAAEQPDRAVTYLRQAVVNASEGQRWDEAAQLQGQLAELVETPLRAEERLRQGQLAMCANRYDEALRALLGALKGEFLIPGLKATCLNDLAMLYQRLDRHETAVEHFEEALRVWTDDADERLCRLHLRLAFSYLHFKAGPNQERLMKAEAQLREARRIIGGQPLLEIDLLMAEVRLRMSQYRLGGAPIYGDDNALKRIGQLVDEHNDRYGKQLYLDLRAYVYYTQGDLQNALNILRLGLEHARQSFDIRAEVAELYNLAYIKGELEMHREASADFKEAARLYGMLQVTTRHMDATTDAAGHALLANELKEAAQLLEIARPMMEDLTPEDPSRVKFDLVSLKLRRQRKETDGLGAALEELTQRARKLGRPELERDVAEEYIRLLISEQAFHKALELINGMLSSLSPQDATARRLHKLAIECHRVSLGETPVESRGAGSAAAPAPAEVVIAASQEDDGETSQGYGRGRPTVQRTLREHSEQVERIKEVVQQTRSLREVAGRMARLTGDIFGTRVLVVLWDAADYQYTARHQMDDVPLEEIREHIVSKVRRSRQTYLSHDLREDDRLKDLATFRTSEARSLACVPLIAGREDRCVGVIYVDHRLARRVTQDAALNVLQSLQKLGSEMYDIVNLRKVEAPTAPPFWDLVGDSPAMRQLRLDIQAVLSRLKPESVVLLSGERGTGHSHIARLIHTNGCNGEGPFVRVGLRHLLAEAFEPTLMGGPVPFGAGPVPDNGLALQAARGVLYLDEIAALDLAQQGRVERLLDERRYRRVTDQATIQLNALVVASTARNLAGEHHDGVFREGLFNLLQRNVIHIPTLRERGADDIRALARHFIAAEFETDVASEIDLKRCFHWRAEELLTRYSWPGNVAQLKAAVTHSSILSQIRSEQPVTVEELERAIHATDQDFGETSRTGAAATADHLPESGLTLEGLNEVFRKWKAEYVEREIVLNGGNKDLTARKMDTYRSALYEILERRPEKTGERIRARQRGQRRNVRQVVAKKKNA